jgi:hypothetical protein
MHVSRSCHSSGTTGPYYTPLSSSIWFFFAGMPVVALKVRGLIQYRHPPAIGSSAWLRFAGLESRYRIRLFGGIGKMAENAALEPSAEMDIRVLKWTLNALDEDHEWEQFFEGIPGFCSSNDGRQRWMVNVDMLFPLTRFFIYTQSSELTSDSVRQRQSVRLPF